MTLLKTFFSFFNLKDAFDSLTVINHSPPYWGSNAAAAADDEESQDLCRFPQEEVRLLVALLRK